MAFSLTSMFRRSDRKRVLTDLMKFDDHLLRDIGLTRGDLAAMRSSRHRATPSRGHE
ncbi:MULTISPECIES: DUF1127 domain-containing protein [unclassified Devosia]|uniref:DUF1127 domain-containing protein n=1 Tax=unclassified Devosia TaxID=196773 RepID=UPI000B19B100|nr:MULTISPECIES: DUF1127 domain-containing protein [unclassified Devosia]MBN9363667.1 DUF1127 domain-containing protein [Devosia sp.]